MYAYTYGHIHVTTNQHARTHAELTHITSADGAWRDGAQLEALRKKISNVSAQKRPVAPLRAGVRLHAARQPGIARLATGCRATSCDAPLDPTRVFAPRPHETIKPEPELPRTAPDSGGPSSANIMARIRTISPCI
jgi:hypothetical protein